MPLSLAEATEAYREAMRESVRRYSLWYMIEGAFLTIAGIASILFPLVSSTAAVIVLGWLLVFSGALQGVGLLRSRHVPHFWLHLSTVLLSLIAGFLVLRDPLQSLLVLTMLVLVFFMLQGISQIVFALTIRPLPVWGYVLASGVLGLALSLLLLVNLPVTAIWLIAMMLGIQFISLGVSMGWMAWNVRKGS